MDSLNLRIGRHRAKWWRILLAVVGIAAVVLLITMHGAVRAGLRTLPKRADAALAAHFVPHYTQRLDALTEENFTLHRAIAAAQPLQQENDAMRALLNSGRAAQSCAYFPARLTERHGGSFALQADTGRTFPIGTIVLDRHGSFAGVVCDADGPCIRVAAAGCGTAAVPCFADGVCGSLQRKSGGLFLADLPRDSALAANTVVTTADEQWVGRLAAAPLTNADGLRAQAALCETTVTADTVYFLQGGGAE